MNKNATLRESTCRLSCEKERQHSGELNVWFIRIRCCSRTEPFGSGVTRKGPYTKRLFMALCISYTEKKASTKSVSAKSPSCPQAPYGSRPLLLRRGSVFFFLELHDFPFPCFSVMSSEYCSFKPHNMFTVLADNHWLSLSLPLSLNPSGLKVCGGERCHWTDKDF